MLVDISFVPKEKFLEMTDGNSLSVPVRTDFWQKHLSPQAVQRSRIQKGVYYCLTANQIDSWSPYTTVMDYQSLDEIRDESLEGPLVNHWGWYGRSKTIDAILNYLQPCIKMPNRKFVVSVQKHEEDWPKSYKCGSFVDDTEDYDCAPFFSFSMEEVEYDPQ